MKSCGCCLLATLLVTSAIACRREDPDSSTAAPQVTRIDPGAPAMPPQPATEPAVRLPASGASSGSVVFQLDGVPLQMPAARATIQAAGEGLTIQLVGEADGRDAATGNSFYFDVPLPQAEGIAQLDGAEWHYQAGDRERADSLNGIFLDGRQQQLQPYDVLVSFALAGPKLTVTIAGRFLLFESPEAIKAVHIANVSGAWSVELSAR